MFFKRKNTLLHKDLINYMFIPLCADFRINHPLVKVELRIEAEKLEDGTYVKSSVCWVTVFLC